MALKQKQEVKQEAPETTALTLFGGLVDQPLSTMVEPEGREYLPFFKLPYGVESLTIPVLDDKGQPLQNKGQAVMQSATGKMVISMGKDKLQALPVPYILTAICIRGATRQTVEKDGKKTYVRTLVPVGKNEDGTFKSPSAKHCEQMVASGIKGSGVDAGNAILAVALFEQDGKPTACVGLMECFKTLTKYFTEPLKSGLLNEGYGLKVTVEDHTVNTTQSKAGFYYFDSRKFNQWSRVQLSKEQVTLVCDSLRAKQAACDAWLKREE